MSESSTDNKIVEPPSYQEKTSRIKAWSQLIASFVWPIAIVIVIIPLIGKFFILDSFKTADLNINKQPLVTINRTIPNREYLDSAVGEAIAMARERSEKFASQELELWIEELTLRVDRNFLPWYFDYFTQKKMELTAPLLWLSSTVKHQLNENKPLPDRALAEKLVKDFQTAFAKRVLRPKAAQLRLERISKETINLYLRELEKNISTIKVNYQIPQGEWNRYLEDLGVTIRDTEGNISNLSMKLLTGGSTYLFAKAMIPSLTKIGSKFAIYTAGKTSAKIASKTGGMVAGKIGAQLLDPIMAIGIVIWDVWDYHQTVELERPVLREAILEYLAEVKASLLDNHQNSIMSAIDRVETGIVQSLERN
jgi:hypothetical protein